MATRKKIKKTQRIVRSVEYKKDAVEHSETVGVPEAARQLGVYGEFQIIAEMQHLG